MTAPADDSVRRGSAAWRQRGVTLIELLVVGAVIALLAAIALPSYRDHILRANRTEARSALLALATAQEKFHLLCHRYAAELDPGKPSDCDALSLEFPPASERAYYTIGITSADAGGWTAEALPDGPPQSRDTACQRLELAGTGRKRAWDAAKRENVAACWGR